MRIIAYTYEADYHCPECAKQRFGTNPQADNDEHGLDPNICDIEGNPIHPVFSTDETEYRDEDTGIMRKHHCGDCETVIQ